MDYGALMTRAWIIVWEHKHLMVLGFLVALASSSSGSGSSYQVSGKDLESTFEMLPGGAQFELWSGMVIAAIVALMCLAIVIGLLFWAVSQVARGALVAGVDTIEDGREASLGTSWRAGWQWKWTLMGIGLVLLIPVLVLLGFTLGLGVLFFGLGTLSGDFAGIAAAGVGVFALVVAVLCIFVPIMLILGLLSNLAYRACMLEEQGVWASYQRGWDVLRENLGPVLVVFLLQIVISIVLFIPSLFAALCFLLWPILLLLQAVVTAYFSTLWTLAWREWTSEQPTAALEAT